MVTNNHKTTKARNKRIARSLVEIIAKGDSLTLMNFGNALHAEMSMYGGAGSEELEALADKIGLIGLKKISKEG